MAEPRHDRRYALEMLDAIRRHGEKLKKGAHAFDQGEITKIGEDEGDIRIHLYGTTIELDGSEVQWMVPEEFLQVGDVVGVAFDAAGDAVVVSAVFQNDPYVVSSGPVDLAATPTYAHSHESVTYQPTAPQTSFQGPHLFADAAPYLDGHRLAEGVGFHVEGRNVVLATTANPGSVVVIDYRIDA